MTYITLYWVYKVQFAQKNVKARRARMGTFAVFTALWGAVVGTFQAAFIVTMKTEVKVNAPHRAGSTPEPGAPSIKKRTRTLD